MATNSSCKDRKKIAQFIFTTAHSLKCFEAIIERACAACR